MKTNPIQPTKKPPEGLVGPSQHSTEVDKPIIASSSNNLKEQVTERLSGITGQNGQVEVDAADNVINLILDTILANVKPVRVGTLTIGDTDKMVILDADLRAMLEGLRNG